MHTSAVSHCVWICLFVCVCFRCVNVLYGHFYWTGWFGMKIKWDFQFVQTLQSVSVGSLCIIFFISVGALVFQLPSSFTCEWKLQAIGDIQVSIEIFYLHFVIVNARAMFVYSWYHPLSWCLWEKNDFTHFKVKVEVEIELRKQKFIQFVCLLHYITTLSV